MKRRKSVVAWKATLIFYVVLLAAISLVSWINGVSTISYWLTQVGLVTLGVGVFVLIGNRYANFSAEGGILIAFGIGVFTIIPGVLMSLNPPSTFWGQYFPIGLAMAAGSLLTFGFMEGIKRLNHTNKNEPPSSGLPSVDVERRSKLMQMQEEAFNQKANSEHGQDNDNNDNNDK